jgi:DNA replication and repair protein RecF
LHLVALKLTNFKNYEFQNLEFNPRLNLIAGLNGMGKTNLLDAIYYLCMGKSHFKANDRSIVRHHEEFFRLEGHFKINKHTDKIVVKVIPGKVKTIERNDNAYMRIADHVGQLPVVFKAPDDVALVHDGSEERRRFMDNTLCQLDRIYLDQLISYNKVLDARNALLKQFAESQTFNSTLLEAFDKQLLPPAKYILEKRRDFVGVFEPVFQQHYTNICEGNESASCRYQSQLLDEEFAVLLEKSLDKDRILQRTTTGIHKDDMELQLNGYAVKRFASQGQLKTFVLALKLAQYGVIKKAKSLQPILLLDDLFDKLDERRVNHLIKMLLSGDFGQVFISDTNLDRVESITQNSNGSYKKFLISNGQATD